ncbi:MAG: RNA polymerase sigma factor [Saprospiraceae bacterium]|nr:RNA polymerase sigma factor [Saprospiraceae bacterium]
MTNQSFSGAIAHNHHFLFNYARKLTGNEHDAKDLLQNTSLKAFRNLDKLDDIRNFKAWITTILYNIFVSDYQKQRRRQELLAKNGSSDAYFYNVSQSKNEGYENLKKKDLLVLTQNVGKKSYEAFELYLIGYSYQEIADLLRIVVGTVKSRINFARTKVKELYPYLSFSDDNML